MLDMVESEKFKPKKVSESSIDNYPYEIFPKDLNSRMRVFGGTIIEIADRLAGKVARTHSRNDCVTKLIDKINFHSPAKLGDILIYKVAVNRAWNTSMEVGVKVILEGETKEEQNHICSMYFTYVAVDDNDNPLPVPPVIPKSKDERRRYKEADIRREARLLEASVKKS